MQTVSPLRSGPRFAFFSLAILSVSAFLTRLYPLYMSRYPFNNDSLTELGIAYEIMDTNHLTFASDTPWYSTHSIATPVLNLVLAFLSSALGVPPEDCAQLLGAVVAVSTIGGIFLLGVMVSGDVRGGIVSGFAAVMMGTFVFTTGSIWKEMAGIEMFIMAILCYARRESGEFRVLTFLLLLIIPFTHHLVAAVTFLFFAYLLVWSWFFALRNHVVQKHSYLDTGTVLVPGVIAWFYYSTVSLDRIALVSSPLKLLLLMAGFAIMCLMAFVVLSMRNHAKVSFAPLVGLGLFLLVVLDYSGYVFPYDPSATSAYLLLGAATAFLVGVAWYGSELIIETRPVHRAIQIALLMSPIAIIGFGLIGGLSLVSHQILYRSFDFLDIFIFIGLGVGVVEILRRHRRYYAVLGALIVISLCVSFPFGYESGPLLGVRHDTQNYEVDAMNWLRDQGDNLSIRSDERLAYIARSITGVPKDSSLPVSLSANEPFPPYLWFYVIEESWTTEGVNYYPHGRLVVPQANYDRMINAADVFYVGGPSNDHLVVFLASEIGSHTVYGPTS